MICSESTQLQLQPDASLVAIYSERSQYNPIIQRIFMKQLPENVTTKKLQLSPKCFTTKLNIYIINF